MMGWPVKQMTDISGIEMVQKTCPGCGTVFRINSDSEQKYSSRNCEILHKNRGRFKCWNPRKNTSSANSISGL